MTSAEKSALRGRAQTLKPVVMVGRTGVTPTVVKELDIALKRLELVKVRFTEGREVLEKHCAELVAGTGAECVGSVGRVASFYRAKPAKNS